MWYSQNPQEILAIPKDRLGSYGALAGGSLCLWLYTWRNDLEVWEWLGLAAPGRALAQAIWRWGDFASQCQPRTPGMRANSSQPKAKAKA